jgi:beta-galactosidase/beta-glucuronidase
MRFLVLLTTLFCFTVARAEPEWKVQENTVIPRPEYPRPDFQRDNWLNLNGIWAFAFDPDLMGLAQNWFDLNNEALQEAIVVPFAWQSPLSGIAEPSHYGVAWYRRTFIVPETWAGQQVVLHFGAVDYQAQVWVNGQLVGEYEGGHTPFEFDITAMLAAGENGVVV